MNGGGFIADNSPVEQNNTWNLAVTANASDYLSLLETAAKAPRQPDGSLPTGFAQLVAGSDLLDKGVDVGIPFTGAAPGSWPHASDRDQRTARKKRSLKLVNCGAAKSQLRLSAPRCQDWSTW